MLTEARFGDHLELELPAVVNGLIGVLGTKLGFSGRAASALTPGSLQPHISILKQLHDEGYVV